MASEPPREVDFKRRRRFALLAVVAVAVGVILVLVLSGGDDEGQTEADKIRAKDAAAAKERTSAAERAVLVFVRAVGEDDFETACGLLTKQVAAQLGDECAAELDRLEIEIIDIRVSGPKAAADVEVNLDGGAAQETSFELLELDEGWRITDFGD